MVCVSNGLDRKIGIFVIADKTSDELLGFTGLFESPLIDEPELSWSLSAKNHGKGYASEAAVLARNWAFREHNIGPLMSLVHPDNISSKRVAERLGASVESHTHVDGAAKTGISTYYSGLR